MTFDRIFNFLTFGTFNVFRAAMQSDRRHFYRRRVFQLEETAARHFRLAEGITTHTEGTGRAQQHIRLALAALNTAWDLRQAHELESSV